MPAPFAAPASSRDPLRRGRSWHVILLAMACGVALSACNLGKPLVPPNDGFAIKLNLLCTTCDDFLRCLREPGEAVAPPGGREPRLVYRLKEKSFWAQIATIGDYLFQAFRQKLTDERPVAIYRDDGVTRTVEPLPTRAFIDAAAGTVALPDSRIDLKNGDWLNDRGERIGRCEAMVRRDGYQMVREFLGRAPAAGADAGPGAAGATAAAGAAGAAGKAP